MVTVPVADGGDGMLDAFEAAGFHRVPVDAADAIGASPAVALRTPRGGMP